MVLYPLRSPCARLCVCYFRPPVIVRPKPARQCILNALIIQQQE